MVYSYYFPYFDSERMASRSIVTAIKGTAYWLCENTPHSDVSFKPKSEGASAELLDGRSA